MKAIRSWTVAALAWCFALGPITRAAAAPETLVWPLPPGIMDGLLGDDGLPIPVDIEGLPSRRLTDAELHRLLLHLSRVMEAATARLARCHVEGTPFHSPGWRACVERP